MKDWSKRKIESSVQLISLTGKKISKREYLESGNFPIIDQGKKFIGGFTDNGKFIIQDSLPVIIFGDHTKTIKFVDFPFAAGADGIKVLKPIDLFNPKFFFYFLQTFQIVLLCLTQCLCLILFVLCCSFFYSLFMTYFTGSFK